MRTLVLLDAPSNLGLRPPAPGTVPGVYKLAGALREQGLLGRLGAREGGVVVPPRYDRGDWAEGDGVFNAEALAAYTVTLADRIERHLRAGEFPVVLGGDCSIQLGASLAMRRTGRYGLAAVDGSADFRHPGNTAVNGPVGAAGGEELALATGRGQASLSDLEGLAPYLRDEDVRLFGLRDGDADLLELAEAGIFAATVGEIRRRGAAAVARSALDGLHPPVTDGFWVHLDADVLDPEVMPAVDSPDPGGLRPEEVAELLAVLVGSPRCVGLNVTIYDPDLDPDGRAGALLADLVAGAFA
ncbi:arginase family protein [Streptomyces virginiae]|uniref:arginase family protein n=1 Tax=Streptomyces TaxID=1883 RepID=UPI0004BD27C4|nr:MULTISPECIES: arginase family protein [Streptomyces]KOU15032.1 arginase [Streptomyces sp. WM6349]KOU97730.1 arginase [Streptomyces sp. XY511]KOV42731.1 arginase [Streptomyces sp. H036]MCI4085787.1 arginase family protein [Streptomyces sp. MMS21 TC-5]MEC4570492.1 arginase family protein [Streptomyces sp. CMAA1738]